MMGHHCHALDCKTPCAPEKLMCPYHWEMVPNILKAAVQRHYRPGQCGDQKVSRDWLAVSWGAIYAVAFKEARGIGKQKAPAKGSEKVEARDYTPEEALAEARRRWGGKGVAIATMGYDSHYKTKINCTVGVGEDGSKQWHGHDFRECFAAADAAKGSGEGGS